MKFRILIICFTTILITAALLVINVGAQNISSKESTSTGPKDEYSLETDISKYPLNPPDTSSPQATLQSFIEYINRSYRVLMAAHHENQKTPGLFTSESAQQMTRQAKNLFERGVYCLNLSRTPEAFKEDIGYLRALELKEIFDRIELPPFDLIPDAQAIEKDQEEKKFPKLVSWRVPYTDIFIAKVEDGPREGQYLFTPQTVARLDEFYKKVKDLPYRSDKFISHNFFEFYISTPGRLLPPKWGQWLPAWSTDIFLGQTIWQWCAFSVVLPFFCIVLAFFRRFLHRAAAKLSPASQDWIQVFFKLVAIGLIVVVRYVLNEQINLTGSVSHVIGTIMAVISWFLLGTAAFRVAAALADMIVASPKIDPKGIQASYIQGIFGIVGFISMALIIIYGLARVGVSLTTLLTGAGIGGIAIALAARPTLENIIASFTIFVDKPYRVGQRVNVMGQDGTVESIGLRSTKIRLLTGPLTVIPNEKMANMEIENIGRRPYIRRLINVTITYDTPPEKIIRAVDILRKILAVPEAVDPKTTDSTGQLVDTAATEGEAEYQPHPNEAINQPDFPPRVYFNELNNDSLNILVIYWYHPPAYWDYLEHANWINTQIMERFNTEGIDFAFPTQTLHLAGDKKRPLTVGQRQISKEESLQSVIDAKK
jgi:MscS family membrane protein